jgi:hypothetical protein
VNVHRQRSSDAPSECLYPEEHAQTPSFAVLFWTCGCPRPNEASSDRPCVSWPYSSRTCPRGTLGCDVLHKDKPGLNDRAPRPPEARLACVTCQRHPADHSAAELAACRDAIVRANEARQKCVGGHLFNGDVCWRCLHNAGDPKDFHSLVHSCVETDSGRHRSVAVERSEPCPRCSSENCRAYHENGATCPRTGQAGPFERLVRAAQRVVGGDDETSLDELSAALEALPNETLRTDYPTPETWRADMDRIAEALGYPKGADYGDILGKIDELVRSAKALVADCRGGGVADHRRGSLGGGSLDDLEDALGDAPDPRPETPRTDEGMNTKERGSR